MNKINFIKDKRLAVLILCVIAANALIWIFSGKSPVSGNVYNSYALQAKAWLNGRLDLGRDYSHLEIAKFDGKFFISFPPFPSIILLPFAVFMGSDTPDHLLALFFACLSAVFAYKLALRLLSDKNCSLLYSLLLCVGSNFLFLTNTGYVWFFAQTLAFCFTLMAFYGAVTRRPSAALLCLCCAMGCRPFQAVYLPFIIYLIYKNRGTITMQIFVKKLIIQALPAIALGLFYMWLNYARFGSVFEFGHNYLPEFVEAPLGQFSLNYLSENLRRLVRLPEFTGSGVRFQKFDGTAFWLVSPIFVTYAALFIYNIKGIKRPETDKIIYYAIPILIALHFILICLHRTMGGWHFGNRYTVDALPALFFGLVSLRAPQAKRFLFCTINILLLIWGFAVNVIGTICLYTNKL